MTKQAPQVSIHKPTIDISPALLFARSITSRPTTSIRDPPSLVSRPPGPQLFVKSHIVRQPLSSSTISTWLHRNFIALCTSEPNVSIRSLASSRALGNWASSYTFEHHYQRNQMAQVDFTTAVFSDSPNHFYDANDNFALN